MDPKRNAHSNKCISKVSATRPDVTGFGANDILSRLMANNSTTTHNGIIEIVFCALHG